LGDPLLFFINHEYYRGSSDKNDVNAFVKSQVAIRKHWLINADLQGRVVNYATAGIDNDLSSYNVQKNLNFFNPKVGIRYNNEWNGSGLSVYASVARAGHEPNRNDYIDGGQVVPRPEYMTDYEVGFQFWKSDKITVKSNLYFMNYKDQLVLTGALNDVGAPLRTNVASSFRKGVENEIQWRLNARINLGGNITFSESLIKDFTEHIFNYDTYIDVAVARGNTPISFSPNRIAAAHAEYELTNPLGQGGLHLSVFANEKYVSAQHLDNTGNTGTIIPSYATTDLGIIMNFSNKEKEDNRMNVLFLVNNIFNRMYASNGYYPQAGRNYMVTLTVKI
jgi:iron complex outermembrane receptor protein